MKRISQLLPTLVPNDAIGNETLYIYQILKSLGYESNIYATNIDPSLKHLAKNFSEYDEKNPDDLIIYHHSTGSGFANFLCSVDSSVMMIYHNITPSKFFHGVNDQIVDLINLGNEETKILKDKVVLGVGDSEYNRLELENIGYKKTTVMPILLDLSKFNDNEDKNIKSKFSNSKNILYVGRIAPNKRIDDVIKSFVYYNMNIEPNSNLIIAGSGTGEYSSKTQKLILDLIKNSENKNIHFVDNPSHSTLATLYKISNLLLLLSEHEGFCVPLIESMFFNVPILTRNSAAIPYTLGNSGVMVNNESFEEIGELIHILINDKKLQESITQKQTIRLKEIYKKSNKTMIEELIKNIQ